MTPRKAYREFSWKFHGKPPGKMKMEKRMKQVYLCLNVPWMPHTFPRMCLNVP